MRKKSLNNSDRLLYSLCLTKKKKENFLSDVLWSICRIDSDILGKFFHFCFKEQKDITVYAMDREVTNMANDARNDFFIYTNKGIFIVESKIGNTDIDSCETYLRDLKNQTLHLRYIVPSNFDHLIIEKLSAIHNVQVVFWEEFIAEIETEEKEFCKQFVVLSNSILGHEELYLQNIVSDANYQSYKNILDQFMAKHLSNIQPDDVQYNNYGYYLWASVWIGIKYCPIKGLFFCITINNNGNRDIEKEQDPYNKKYENLTPLGKYSREKDVYYEIRSQNGNYTDECLVAALKEFGDFIDVKIDGIYKPLLKYLKFRE